MAVIILVVARHSTLRQSLGDWLGMHLHDCQILLAASPSDAVPLLRRRGVQLVIVDLHEPWGEGLAAIRNIRTAVPDVPLIALGLEESEVHRSHASEAGATSYVAKSKLQAELLPTVERILAARETV